VDQPSVTISKNDILNSAPKKYPIEWILKNIQVNGSSKRDLKGLKESELSKI
jgi:hypothetical protein